MSEKRKELEKRLATVRENTPGISAAKRGNNNHNIGRNWPGNGNRGGAGRKRPRPKNAALNAAAAAEEAAEKGSENSKGEDQDEDEEFLVAEYESGGERGAGGGNRESSSDEEVEKDKKGWRAEEEREWEDLGLRQVFTFCVFCHFFRVTAVFSVSRGLEGKGIEDASYL